MAVSQMDVARFIDGELGVLARPCGSLQHQRVGYRPLGDPLFFFFRGERESVIRAGGVLGLSAS